MTFSFYLETIVAVPVVRTVRANLSANKNLPTCGVQKMIRCPGCHTGSFFILVIMEEKRMETRTLFLLSKEGPKRVNG